MQAEFHSIGIDLDPTEVISAVTANGLPGIQDVAGFAICGVYVDPSGARVAVGAGPNGTYVDAHVTSEQSHLAEVFRISDTLAHVDLIDDGEITARFLAYVDDPVTYPRYDLGSAGEPRTIDLKLGALCVDAKVYPSEEDFLASDVWGMQSSASAALAPNHLLSPGVFALYAGEASAADLSGHALIGAICRTVERRTTALTGQDWWHVVGDSAVPMTLALPIDISPHPEPGFVVAGKFILVASGGGLG